MESAIPRVVQRIQSGQKLGGKGNSNNPTKGGEALALPPQLLLYPEALKVRSRNSSCTLKP